MKMKDMTIHKITIPAEGQKMKLLILRPKKTGEEPATGVLWIHGGGYALGMAESVLLSRAVGLVRRQGAVVLAPEYRLSGRAPYPAALNDCYAALLYMKDHAQELGIREDQLMVGGESAGGGLTAALCMLARDRGEVKIAYQMPLYPMLDDRDTETSRDNHAPVWNTRRNHWGWRKYLRDLPEGEETPPYAAPARQSDYRGLPPAYTFVGDIEPFYAETHAFIRNLQAAGVQASIDTYHDEGAGCFHAFDEMTPWREVSRQAAARFEEKFAYAKEHYIAPQPEKAVALVPFRREDTALFRRWLEMPHVSRWYHEPEDWLREVEDREGEYRWIHHFIVQSAGNPIGFAQYYEYRMSGEAWHGSIEPEGAYSIDYLVGEPEYLRRGFGRKMVEALIEAIRKLPGAKRILVQPEQENLASRALLCACGFMRDAENDVYSLELT